MFALQANKEQPYWIIVKYLSFVIEYALYIDLSKILKEDTYYEAF